MTILIRIDSYFIVIHLYMHILGDLYMHKAVLPHHAPFAGATFISGCSAVVGGSGQSSRSAGKSLENT